MNKQIRNERKQLKYIKRIKRWVENLDVYITRSGDRINNPSYKDVVNDGGQNSYKTTSTPCSCFMCSHSKYKRHLKRIEDYKLMEAWQSGLLR